jgi:hypothetical protein
MIDPIGSGGFARIAERIPRMRALMSSASAGMLRSAAVGDVGNRVSGSGRSPVGNSASTYCGVLGGTLMRIHNLYTDASGQSHFRDIEVEWIEERRGSKLSRRLPATGIIFRETQAEHDIDWHPAPRRQYIVNLDAGVKITASDGESRVIGIGEVILVEDTTGKGHLSQHVEGKIRHSIFVPVE